MSLPYRLTMNKSLQRKIIQYLKHYPKTEIFLGLIGSIHGKGKNSLEFKIQDMIPFPNLSERPEYQLEMPIFWDRILKEYFLFHHYSKGKRILGVLHSHPMAMPVLSQLDKEFGIGLAKELGNAIMAVVGKNNVLYVYLIEDSNIHRIKHSCTSFKKRYQLKSPKKIKKRGKTN